MKDYLDFSGKRAIVTGGRRGLGVALRHIQRSFSGRQRLAKLLGEGQPVPPGRLLKIQQNAAVSPPAALPQHRGAQLFRFADQGSVPVIEGKEPAPDLKQQVLPQTGGALANAVGHMGEGAAAGGCLRQLRRCYGQIHLQMNTAPLVRSPGNWYTGNNLFLCR